VCQGGETPVCGSGGGAFWSAAIHAELLTVASVVLYLLLVAAWIIVAIRTAHGSYRGYLFQPTPTPQFRYGKERVTSRKRQALSRGLVPESGMLMRPRGRGEGADGLF